MLDPISNDIKRQFPLVILLGETGFDLKNCQKFWQCKVPVALLPENEKLAIMASFEQAADTQRLYEDPSSFTKSSIPKIDNLAEYLKKHHGQTLVLTLQDNRIIAVYPDDQKFSGKYDIEVHYSTLVNMDLLFKMFNVKEITVRE